MLKVGITGGMGSGKTTVCRIFEHLKVPVYYADDRAKHLVNVTLRENISASFGEDIYTKEGLDRALLAKRAFVNKEKTDLLNSIVHPAVALDYDDWVSKQNGAYSIKEAALLIESESYKTLDKIILVSAPLETRIQRILKRDKTSREDINNRISKQLSDEEKEKYADYFINNDGDSSLVEQVLQIHKSLLEA